MISKKVYKFHANRKKNDIFINPDKIIELYKRYNSCYEVAARLCPVNATYQEWLAFYYKVIDIIDENNLI